LNRRLAGQLEIRAATDVKQALTVGSNRLVFLAAKRVRAAPEDCGGQGLQWMEDLGDTNEILARRCLFEGVGALDRSKAFWAV